MVLFTKSTLSRRLILKWRPPKSDIIVYSRDSLPYLKNLLGGFSYEVMDTGFKRNFSGRLCLSALFRAALDKELRNVPLFGRYLAHYVQLAECRLIISAVDARAPLSHAALLSNNVRRIAFQVSTSTVQFIPDEQFKNKPADVCVVWSDDYLREVVELTTPALPLPDIKPKIVSLGSIKSNQVPIVPKKPLKNSVLFISQWRPHYDESFYMQERQLLPMLQNWCASRGLDLYVLGCSLADTSGEKAFFKNSIQAENFRYLARSDEWQSSFYVLDEVSLVVSVNSALGLEALSRGRKTVFFSNSAAPYPRVASRSIESSPSASVWISDGNLEEFWKMLDKASQMDEEDFFMLICADGQILPPRDEGLRKTRALVEAEMNIGSMESTRN